MNTIINLTPHAITISGQGYTDGDFDLFAGPPHRAGRSAALPVRNARSMPGRIEFGLVQSRSLADLEVALCGSVGTGRWEFGALSESQASTHEFGQTHWARRAGTTTLPPSGSIARGIERVSRGDVLELSIPDPTGAPTDRLTRHVPTTMVAYEGTIDLPAPSPGIWYVVSVITAQAAYLDRSGRTTDDLLVPGEQIRDTSGRVIGCASLIRWRPQWWSRRAYLDMVCSQAGSAASESSGYWPKIQELVPAETLNQAVHAFEMLLAGCAEPTFFAGDLARAGELMAALVATAQARATPAASAATATATTA